MIKYANLWRLLFVIRIHWLIILLTELAPDLVHFLLYAFLDKQLNLVRKLLLLEQLPENKGRSVNLLVFLLVKMVTSVSLFRTLLRENRRTLFKVLDISYERVWIV